MEKQTHAPRNDLCSPEGSYAGFWRQHLRECDSSHFCSKMKWFFREEPFRNPRRDSRLKSLDSGDFPSYKYNKFILYFSGRPLVRTTGVMQGSSSRDMGARAEDCHTIIPAVLSEFAKSPCSQPQTHFCPVGECYFSRSE